MPDFVAIKATIYPQKHTSGNVTWKVKHGKKFDGRFLLKNFKTKVEAEIFQREWNLKLVEGKTSGLADLDAITKHEVLAALEKLKAYNATLPEAVEFFLRYARPEKGLITIKEAIDVFTEAKGKAGRSEKYLKNCQKTFYKPFERAFPEGKIVSEITPTEAEKYTYAKASWGQTTRASHISYLRTFYEFLIKRGYAKLNPFKSLDKPVAISMKAKVLKPDVVQKLLQYALDNDCKAECACMALVFFCGVRVFEVERLEWKKIDLVNRRVHVEWEDAKKRKRRVNTISDNAWEWLNLCKADGDVAPNDYEQRMKRLRQRAGIAYAQNAMRHCFAGYHIAKHGDAIKTAYMLSHPNANLLYTTYYACVSPDDVEAYWKIIPAAVKAKREEQSAIAKQEADNSARQEAEEASNCGTAVFENGQWIPVQRRNATEIEEESRQSFPDL